MVMPGTFLRTFVLSAVAVALLGLTPVRAEIAIAMAGPMTGAYCARESPGEEDEMI